MIHDGICPVHPIGPRANAAIAVMAADDADATGGPFRTYQHETLESWDLSAVGQKTSMQATVPSMMGFFLPTRARAD
jgi:hypothetical protein